MLKYKPITKLTDDEVVFIVDKLLSPHSINSIHRTEFQGDPAIEVEFGAVYGDDIESFVATESVILTDPFENDEGIYSDDDVISQDCQEEFKRYCLAKGVCIYLKENPFL